MIDGTNTVGWTSPSKDLGAGALHGHNAVADLGFTRWVFKLHEQKKIRQN
uniref:Uncharacterized protein n=1 Tax=Arundo donax TaxID=35708 RepID=A0A0A9HHE2_ARUDO